MCILSLLPPSRRHRRRPRLRQRVDARRQAGSFPGAHVRHLLLVLLEERERLEELLLAAARLGAQLVVVRREHRVPRVGGVRARRLGLAAAARLLEVPPNRFRALERLARPRELGLGRRGAALEVGLRRAPPRLRALVRLLDRQELLDELRHAPLLRRAQVGERAALRGGRRRRLGARGRDDLGEGGHGCFRYMGPRVGSVTTSTASGDDALGEP